MLRARSALQEEVQRLALENKGKVGTVIEKHDLDPCKRKFF